MFVRTLERSYTLTYILCLEFGCAHLKILELRFLAHKRHYINLEPPPFDCKSFFKNIGLGFVIKNLPAFELLQLLKRANNFFPVNIFSFVIQCKWLMTVPS
jgi:hypothetical protein